MQRMADFIFLGSKITVDGDCSHKIKRHLLLGRKAMTNLDSVLKKKRHHFANKGPYSQGYSFSRSHVRTRELDHKEGWTPKNWCFWIVVVGNTLESPLNSKEIKPVNPKGNQSWIFIGRTDAEAEAPIFWPLDAKNRHFRKDPDTGKDWGHEKKRVTENEMVGWHHRLNGHEFEQILGDSEGQGSLGCCGPWGYKESDTTWWLNNDNQLSGASILLFSMLSPLGVHSWEWLQRLRAWQWAAHLFPFWVPSGLTIWAAVMWWLDGCKILYLLIWRAIFLIHTSLTGWCEIKKT